MKTKNSKTKTNLKTLPLVSAVITTKNEEKNIASCLESLRRQDYNNLEIIVVDHPETTDKTREIARKYTDKVYNFPEKEITQKFVNFRGAQLNFGVNQSRGEIIFFPDADMTFDQELFSEVAQKMKEFDALYVQEIIVGSGFWGKVRNFERSFYNQTVVDAFRVVKKNIFLAVGGFDEKNIAFGADDWDFTKRIKKATSKCSITENKLFHHEERISWKTFLSKKGKYVDCFNGYIKKWGENDPDIKKQLGVWYRSVVVFTEDGKWKKLLANPSLAISMYFVRFLTWLSFKIKF